MTKMEAFEWMIYQMRKGNKPLSAEGRSNLTEHATSFDDDLFDRSFDRYIGSKVGMDAPL